MSRYEGSSPGAWLVGTLLLTGALLIGSWGVFTAGAGGGYDDHHEGHERHHRASHEHDDDDD